MIDHETALKELSRFALHHGFDKLMENEELVEEYCAAIQRFPSEKIAHSVIGDMASGFNRKIPLVSDFCRAAVEEEERIELHDNPDPLDAFPDDEIHPLQRMRQGGGVFTPGIDPDADRHLELMQEFADKRGSYKGPGGMNPEHYQELLALQRKMREAPPRTIYSAKPFCAACGDTGWLHIERAGMSGVHKCDCKAAPSDRRDDLDEEPKKGRKRR